MTNGDVHSAGFSITLTLDIKRQGALVLPQIPGPISEGTQPNWFDLHWIPHIISSLNNIYPL